MGLGPPAVWRGGLDPGRRFEVNDALYTMALRNADRYEALARRAEGSSDGELAEFFRRMRDESRQNAEKAKTLLARRVAE